MLTPTFRKRSWIAGALTALALSAAAPRAEACGGFFCSASPVDQTAEHILFTVNSDQTVTAIVQIQYVGDKDNFAWIIPAPGVPKLATDFPDSAMRSLALATDPRYFKNNCNRGLAVPGVGAAQSATAGNASADNGVTVLAMQAVGPYDTTTLEATDSKVLVDWLQQHNYRITTKMIPILQPYIEAGMHFVALRLQANKQVSDIQPLGMTYDANKPSIPLQLTAVAAQPEMGIVAWILADSRWAPENYIDLKIPDKLIQFDQYGNQNNYLTLVSSESDKVGGQAFVTEYAKATSELTSQLQNMFAPTDDGMKAKAAILDVLSQHPYITRLYARISAEEMTVDPTFMVASNTADVDNVHDLSDPNMQCSFTLPEPPAPDPCTFTYCGRRGVCVGANMPGQTGAAATTVPACACATDAVGRMTTTTGQPSTYCEPVSVNFDSATPDGGAGVMVKAACEGVDCGGHGTCMSMNGNPSCQCDKGYGAVASYASNTGANVVTCVAVSGNVPPLPRLPAVGSTKIANDAASSGSTGGCNVAPRTAGSGAALGALAGLALAGVRRRRRRF